MKKIVILLLLLVSVTAFYFYNTKKTTVTGVDENSVVPSNLHSANSNTNTDWKTYTNTQYGYSISVPKEAEVNSQVSNIYFEGANIGISVFPKNGDVETDMFREPELHQFVKTIVAGKEAYRDSGYGSAGAFFITTLLYGSTQNYEIQFSDEHGERNSVLANQIVETFAY